MEVKKVLQDGSVFDAKVLDLSNEVILSKFSKAIDNMACLSLGSGYSTSASAPHTLLNGFKNLVAVSAMSGWEFPQAKAMLSAAAAAPKAAGGAPVAAAAAVEEEKPKEEEEPVDMGGLFGDDDEY